MKTHTRLAASFLITLLVACPAVNAQRARHRRAAPAPQRNVELERAQREIDEEAVRRMSDPGFDFAVVTAASVIREDADPAADVLLRVKRGDTLALVSRETYGKWYNVIHVETATEGWIDQKDVVARFTNIKREGPKFESESTGTYSNPEIVIKNDSNTNLNLKLGGQKYVVPANSTKSITVNAGSYKFHCYAPGVSPLFGEHSFNIGHNYTWTFWIETVVR